MFVSNEGSAQPTSPFEKGGLRGIFGSCHSLTTENLPQSLFRKEGERSEEALPCDDPAKVQHIVFQKTLSDRLAAIVQARRKFAMLHLGAP
jgi:hypothetical protein